MRLSDYTSGHLRSALPPEIFHDHYPLVEDLDEKLHAHDQCGDIRGLTHVRQTSPQEITPENECSCLVVHHQAPPEFRMLLRYDRWPYVLTVARDALEGPSAANLHNAWKRTHALLQNIDYTHFLTRHNGSEHLTAFLAGEHRALLEVEVELRERIQSHPQQYQRIHQKYSQRERLEPGTHLVFVAAFGLEHAAPSGELTCVLLQMDGIDPWKDTTTAVASEEVLSLFLHLSRDWDHHEDIEYVRLDEGDTPAIQEITRGLWNPGFTPLTDALEIARRV